MEEPVSAFAMYNSNKKDTKKKNRKKKNKNKTPAPAPAPTRVLRSGPDVSEKQMKELGAILKKKQKKKKEPKNITKKKIHKKRKNKKPKVKASPQKLEMSDHSSEGENIPVLTPVPAALNGEVWSDSDGSFEFTPVQTDSAEEGLKVFKWMIAPFNPQDFLNQIWEKKPLHIARNKPKYYNELISTPVIDTMLRTENIQYTKNIDITTYVNGKRETHNPEGRAHPHLVWDFYLNGCSIRLLNPQTYISKVHLLNATLQEFFTSFVGANVYLTPPDSQGFAPHFDDIEAFILQAEGKKRWRVYKPRDDNEVLARFSSGNFTDEDIGEPILEVTLEAGDMLYFPRGYIHQAVTIDGEHSLHITISMYQKHCWADLFEKLIPAALQTAINNDVELRRGLPLDIFDNFGYIYSDAKSPRRGEIEKLVKKLFDKIKNYLSIDNAADQMNKQFQEAALPPVLSDLEKSVTVYGDSDTMVENGKVTNRVEIGLDTRVRLLRKNIVRLVSEESLRLYYHAENSLEYHEYDLPFIEVEEFHVPAIETLILTYPEYVAVENLDMPNDSDKLDLASALWGRGLIMTEYPLENIDDD